LVVRHVDEKLSQTHQASGEDSQMSTLAVVEEILRETAVPMSVREIVQRAGVRLPSKSKTPDTVVARDLSLDIKRKGETSRFTRTSPGRYTLRDLAARTTENGASASAASPLASTALKQERAAALPAKLGNVAKSGSAQVG
jgi:uncharacterized protein (UPF0147 family)